MSANRATITLTKHEKITPIPRSQTTLGPIPVVQERVQPRRQIRDLPSWKVQTQNALNQLEAIKQSQKAGYFIMAQRKTPKPKKASKKAQAPHKKAPKRPPNAEHTDLTHYLGYLNHRHHDVRGLRAPSAVSRRTARWTSWGRFTTTSGAASTQTTCLILNPMRWCEGTVWKGSDLAQSRPAAEYGILTNGNVLLPSSGWGTSFVPSEGYFSAPSTWAGNHFGYRRWLGLTLHIRYLGTALNAGGEVTVVHDDTAGGAAGSTSDNLRAHPRARRFALPANGQVVSINIFPSGDGAAFADLPQYNTVGSGFADTTSPGDSRVYGLSGISSGAAQIAWGKADVPWGWNTALLINPAADAQRYEVTCTMQYEGQLATVTSSSAEAARIQRLPINESVTADPEGAALVDTITHGHVLSGPNTNKPAHTFDLVVKKALATLAPVAERIAAGYANRAVAALGF